MIQFLTKRWVYHSIIWTVPFIVLTLTTYYDQQEANSLWLSIQESVIFVIPIVITTYLAFWAKQQLFDSRKYLLYTLAAIAIVAIGVTVYETLDLLDGDLGNPRSMNISNFIFLQVFVVGLQYFKRGIINQYQLQELRAKTALTELQALKAQINPHFLFNTLNNIYGMNQISPEKGSEMIMELSEVMRYHLEFSKEGKVTLADEIQLLESYIKLEQLRLRETCDLQVDIKNVNEGLMVSPLLFLPFIENAFKHGTHPTKDCFVHITLTTTANKLLLVVKNSSIANRKVVKTNVGLQNTKRRLELLYPEKHDLDITKNEAFYLVELSIAL